MQRLRMVGSGTEADRDIRVNSRPGQKAWLLKHNPRQAGSSLRQISDFDRSRRGLVESGDEPQQSALAAAAAADDG